MRKLKSLDVNIRTEAIAGITTFFTMAYIVVVNPLILSTPVTYALALVSVGLLVLEHGRFS